MTRCRRRGSWSVIVVGSTAAIAFGCTASSGRSAATTGASPAQEMAAETAATGATTTTPTGTAAPTGTTTPTRTTTTTAAASPTTTIGASRLSVSYLDPPPMLEPRVFAAVVVRSDAATSERQVPPIAVMDDGAVVVLDPLAADAVVVASDGTQRRVPLDVGAMPVVVTGGPDGVVYGLVLEPVPDGEKLASVVAIPLAGHNAGVVVAAAPTTLTPSDDLFPTRLGHSSDWVVDRLERTDLLGHVDGDGAATTLDRFAPEVTLEPDGFLHGDDASYGWQLDIDRHPDAPLDRQTPTTGHLDGGAVHWISIGAPADGAPTLPVIARLRADDGGYTGVWRTVPDGWVVAASDLWGTVLARRTGNVVELAWLDDALDPDPASVTRPVIDVDGCAWVSAREGGGFTGEVRLFARSSTLPIVRQVYGDPSASIEKPYALVQRYFADVRIGGGPPGSGIDINGRLGYGWASADGRGSLQVLLHDGSELYIRSKGLDATELAGLARLLVPRPADSPVAAFDVASPLPRGLVLLDETPGPLSFDGGASSICVVDEAGNEMRVGVTRGDIVSRFGAALDAGRLPLVRHVDAQAHLWIYGWPQYLLDADESLRQATDDEWARLLRGPPSQDFHWIPMSPRNELLTAALATQSFDSRADLEAELIRVFSDSSARALDDFTVAYAASDRFAVVSASLAAPTDPGLDPVWLVHFSSWGQEWTVRSVWFALRCGDTTRSPPPPEHEAEWPEHCRTRPI